MEDKTFFKNAAKLTLGITVFIIGLAFLANGITSRVENPTPETQVETNEVESVDVIFISPQPM